MDINYHKNNRSPKDVDVFAGEQLKKRRKELGMSQKVLAESLGVTFQQVQKYEKGLNRIGASRLYDLCEALKTKSSYFFKKINYDLSSNKSNILSVAEGISDTQDVLSLVKMFNSIDDGNKKIILELLKSLSSFQENN